MSGLNTFKDQDVAGLREELVRIEVRDVEIRSMMKENSEILGEAFDTTLRQREQSPTGKDQSLGDDILSLSVENDGLHNEHMELMNRRKIVLDELIRLEEVTWGKK